jgi:putative ABC transport system substrate-binding protein
MSRSERGEIRTFWRNRALPILAAALGLACCLASVAADAQQAPKMVRLGWLQTAPSSFPIYRDFIDGMHELGYVEGKNIDIVVRSAQGQLDRLPALARELIDLHPDAIFTGADQGLRAAKDATDTIPIVVVVCDPLDALIASIARPGGKATGLTCIASELASKRLQLMKEFVPSLTSVAVLYNPGDHNKQPEYRQMQNAAQKLGLTLTAFEARSAGEIDKAFVDMGDGRFQALVILTDALMVIEEKRLADLALSKKLPAMFGFREFAEAGGLVSYGASLHEIYHHAAGYVDKILHGADPGSIPIEQPTHFEMVINQKAAKSLGIAVPPSLLALSDDVIE